MIARSSPMRSGWWILRADRTEVDLGYIHPSDRPVRVRVETNLLLFADKPIKKVIDCSIMPRVSKSSLVKPDVTAASRQDDLHVGHASAL
jgi:hypothetical protein